MEVYIYLVSLVPVWYCSWCYVCHVTRLAYSTALNNSQLTVHQWRNPEHSVPEIKLVHVGSHRLPHIVLPGMRTCVHAAAYCLATSKDCGKVTL